MHSHSIYLPILLLLLSLFSCETVIEVDLNEAAPQLTIEALLSEGDQDFQVRISQTGAYFGSGSIQLVDGAEVQLTEVGASPVLVPQIGPGLYQLSVTGVSGKTYQLSVTIDGIEYLAQSYLPPAVQLDSLVFEFQEATPFFDEGYQVFSAFKDPADIDNYYRVLYDLNGEPQRDGEDFQVVDDRATDGNEVELPLFGKVFEPGDLVSIELRSIDEAAYDYYASLADNIGANTGPGGGSAAPGNPVSNWSGDILGYFIAYSSDSASVRIP